MVSYFEDWLEENDIQNQDIGIDFAKLHEIFQNADKDYNKRFERKSSSASVNRKNAKKADNAEQDFFEELRQNFETYLKDIEAIENKLKNSQEDNQYKKERSKKMLHLTKGNVLLRYGQYMGEHFYDPLEYYQQACILLKQVYDPDSNNFLDLMIQLNLGKYFRNMGKHNQRNDYWRALDEFEDVEKKIKVKMNEKRRGENELWKIHIWLETRINIGRAHRYLYHIQKAKECFLEIIRGLLPELNKNIHINDVLDSYFGDNISADTEPALTESKRELYQTYLIQALVQLAIVYQKSRDYDMSLDICETILNEQEDNVDAKNSKGVCLWKQDRDLEKALEHAMYTESSKSFRETKDMDRTCSSMSSKLRSYEVIFNELSTQGNRFANLYKIKCDVYSNTPPSKIEKSIDDLLKRNPADREVRLLQGIFLQKQKKYKDSTDVLKKLYEETPHISKGTIGLKAYYNIAQNLFLQGDYHNAKKYFEKILNECGSCCYPNQGIASSNTQPAEKGQKEMRLDDLPEGDLLAEIGQGLCLMHLGYYKKAKDCYEKILQNYKKMNYRIGRKNEIRINNNLAECYLHLARDPVDGNKYLRKAKEKLDSVYSKEPDNCTINLHLGYYHYEHIRQTTLEWDKELKLALKHFQKAETYPKDYREKGVYINAGWISACVFPLLKEDEFDMEESHKKELLQRIENRLKYSSGTYSIKACAKLAFALKIMEKEFKQETARLDTMYRSLARIQLYEHEEGYALFQRLLKNNTFRKLEATKRGELLVCLFRLYQQIIKIKDICKITPNNQASDMKEPIPVHYTKISTLKKLLPENPETPGKLRLWNTIYMNDSFEGECFIEMMKTASEQVQLNNQDGNKHLSEKIEKYFPQPNKKNIDEDILTPINENIYVTSFTKLDNAIPMWVSYADDAKGCTITFTEDFLDIQKAEDTLTDVSIYSDQDYPLYVIQYVDETDGKVNPRNANYKNSEDKIQKILKIMEEIWNILDDLETRMEEDKSKNKWDAYVVGLDEKGIIRNFVTSCLNEVRFLFKSSEYGHEAEIRMIHHSFAPKIDLDNFDVPRLYVEVEKDIQIEKVQLGPKIEASQANEIVTWLTNTRKVAHITKSGRHYK